MTLMNKIKVLDNHLTNMIAAGEVVERPAGIIKELIENSIDAKATQIEVRVKEGGMELIEVSDNGEGMNRDDLQQAFERHSTSKISSTYDLNQIQTFGFRGEALPSIASVSYVEAISNNGEEGHQIIINNGVMEHLKPHPRNQGTTIYVRNLFLKTPARLKHIKNIHYENSIISDIVQKFAIGNPDISFTLKNDETITFRSHGRTDLMDVFHRVYGNAITSDSETFSYEDYDFKISGIMALPQHNRSNRYSIWLYINNRMIRFPKVQKAIVDAYRRHMPTDRYPIVVMNIEVDPQLVDVNVHPSKWEIRLSKEKELIELILASFEGKLNADMKPQKITFKEPVVQADFKTELFEQPIIKIEEPTPSPFKFVEPVTVEPIFESEKVEMAGVEPEVQPVYEEVVDTVIEEEPQTEHKSLIEPLKVLSQMSGCYILAQGDSGLYIIDQHAAMERVRYEYYQEKLLSQQTPVQDFLIPLVIDNRKVLIPRIDEINDVFKDFQIQLELLTEDSFIIRSVPTWIKQEEVHEFINDILDQFEAEDTIREEDMRRMTLATLACHSSVRFNEYMSMVEMETLVSQLRSCKQPFNCPHGRPTFITVEHKQLIKEFKR